MKIWPFNRKKKTNDVNKNVGSFAQATTRKSSLASVLGSFIAAFIILAAGATGIGISAWKQTLGSEYSNSYNVRFELEPQDEQEYMFSETPPTTETYAELAEDAADAYSRFLHEKGVDDINVYPEWVPKDETKNPHEGRIFINAVVPNDYYYNTLQEKRIEVPKQELFMNYMNSSRLTALIQENKGGTQKIGVIPLEDYIDTNRPINVNSNDPTQVDIKLKKSFKTIVDECLNEDSTTNDDANNSQIYIVQNYYELLNYLTFILQVGSQFDKGSASEFTDIWNYWKYNKNGNNGEIDFYDTYKKDHNGRIESGTNTLSDSLGDGYGYVRVDDANDLNLTDDLAPKPADKNVVTDAPFYFESKKDDDGKWTPTSSINYNFLKKYVLAFGQPDKKDTQPSEQVANSFLKILPNKDPTNTKEDSNFQWLTISTGDRYKARNIVNSIKNFQFPVTIKPITAGTYAYATPDTKSIYGFINNNESVIEQNFKPSIFGYSPIVGLIVSLGLIILGIGIIVSILYRIPGLFGTASILGALGLTLMTMILSNYVVSLPLFLGLLVGVLGSTLAIFSWCGRIRKMHRTGLLFDVAVRKGIKRGFLPTIDIHMIMLLIGICISYFGANQINAFGNALLIFSIISFAITALVWALLVLLLFNNRIGSNKAQWFFKRKVEKPVALGLEKNYETVYSAKFETKRFSLFGKRQIICASLIGLIAIVGIILIFTVGVHSSYNFYGGSRLIMNEWTYNQHISDFAGYSDMFSSNGLVYLYYDHVFDLSKITGLVNDPDTPWVNGYVSLQSISSAGVMDYTRSSIYAILIVSGLLSAYAFVRLNWVSVIPVFLGLLVTPLLTVGVMSICQIYFDAYIVIAIMIVYALNAFLVIQLINLLNNQWIRKQIFSPQDLRKIFNAEIKNSLTFFAWCYGILIGTFIIMILSNTVSLTWFYAIIIIGIVASIPTLYAVVPICLYVFIRLRYRYLMANNFENPLLRKNYDGVDEQLIEGINQFKRKKPIL